MFAGTAGSVPSARRGLPALAVRRGAERILIDERPIIVLYHGVKFVGISTSVTGVQLYPDLVPHLAFAQYK